MKPFRVQLIGGIVLHQGRIAEMKTGEGKTLVAVLPAYLNAIAGEGVHIVTVNDYLARRDSEWMGKVHRFMGLSVGLIVHGLTPEERRAAYAATSPTARITSSASTTCATTWRYTRARWSSAATPSPSSTRWTPYSIDEARTPLIISGSGDESTDLYRKGGRLRPHASAASPSPPPTTRPRRTRALTPTIS